MSLHPWSRKLTTRLSQKIPWPSNHWTSWLSQNQTTYLSRKLVARDGTIHHKVCGWVCNMLCLTVRSNIKPKCGNNSSESLHVFLCPEFRLSPYRLHTRQRSELYTASSKLRYRLRAGRRSKINALVLRLRSYVFYLSYPTGYGLD